MATPQKLVWDHEFAFERHTCAQVLPLLARNHGLRRSVTIFSTTKKTGFKDLSEWINFLFFPLFVHEKMHFLNNYPITFVLYQHINNLDTFYQRQLPPHHSLFILYNQAKTPVKILNLRNILHALQYIQQQ